MAPKSFFKLCSISLRWNAFTVFFSKSWVPELLQTLEKKMKVLIHVYNLCSLYNVTISISNSAFIGHHETILCQWKASFSLQFFSMPLHLQQPPIQPQSVKMEPLCHMVSKQACAGLIMLCPPSAPTLNHAKVTERGGRASKPPPMLQLSRLFTQMYMKSHVLLTWSLHELITWCLLSCRTEFDAHTMK